VNELQQLIREEMHAKRLSYEDVEERARAAGAPVSKSTVHALATSKALKRAPTREVLQGLAEGLGVALETVQRACLRALGWNLEVNHSADVEQLIAYKGEMSERDWRTILRMAEVLRRNQPDE
jgi:transcriptional regulator with XRE-family HTH domain